MRISFCSLTKWTVGLALLSSSFLPPVYADSLTSTYAKKAWYPVVSLGVGGLFSSDIGKSQNFPIQNPIEDQFYNYSAHHTSQSVWLFNGFLGAEFSAPCPLWRFQVGLGYYQPESFNVNGTFLQGADVPSADTFNYHYRMSTKQLLVEGKLLYTMQERYHPYISLGLGAAFNKAYDYTTNVPPFLTFTREYANHDNTSFSYAVGVGIDTNIDCAWRLGIGYRFADFGKIKLGGSTIDGVSVPGTLSQSHLYANEVLAQLTWLAI